MAHTFLQEISGCLLLSFYLTTSFKYKFVLIPLDFKAFLFFFFFLTLKMALFYLNKAFLFPNILGKH